VGFLLENQLGVEKIYKKGEESFWRNGKLDYLCRTFLRKIRGMQKTRIRTTSSLKILRRKENELRDFKLGSFG
jgi:hypothetical protein